MNPVSGWKKAVQTSQSYVGSLLFWLVPLLLGIGLFLLSSQATAQTVEDDSGSGEEEAVSDVSSHTQAGFTLFADILGRYNPNGVVFYAGGAYRFLKRWHEQYKTYDHYLQAGVLTGINPAYAQAGVFLEWLPAAFAVLRLQTDTFGFFGANAGLLSFPTAQASYSDRAQQRRRGDEEVSWGQRVIGQFTLRAKIDRLVIRNQTDLGGYWFGGQGAFVLEMEYDILMRTADVLIADRPALLLDCLNGPQGETLLLGPFYDIAYSLRAESRHQRLGVMLYTEPWVSLGRFDRPRFYLMTGTHVESNARPWGVFVLAGIGSDFDL